MITDKIIENTDQLLGDDNYYKFNEKLTLTKPTLMRKCASHARAPQRESTLFKPVPPHSQSSVLHLPSHESRTPDRWVQIRCR